MWDSTAVRFPIPGIATNVTLIVRLVYSNPATSSEGSLSPSPVNCSRDDSFM
jgi:hypothetical protein